MIAGKLVLVGFVSLLPVLLLAWSQGRIRRRTLYWIASFAALGLTFFLCTFMGTYLDPRDQDLPIGQRLATSLVAVAVAMAVGIDQAGHLSLSSISPEKVTCSCTIFAESEVVSLVAKGRKREDILMGLHQMVDRRLRGMINSMRGKGAVFMGGGVALNRGVVKALSDLMDREMVRILKDQGLADAKASLDWPSFETSAILTVPSLNYSGLLHYIVWDAEAQQYLDPANEPLRYPDDGPVIAEERTVCWATAILW